LISALGGADRTQTLVVKVFDLAFCMFSWGES
jgi:hypothetical protein